MDNLEKKPDVNISEEINEIITEIKKLKKEFNAFKQNEYYIDHSNDDETEAKDLIKESLDLAKEKIDLYNDKEPIEKMTLCNHQNETDLNINKEGVTNDDHQEKFAILKFGNQIKNLNPDTLNKLYNDSYSKIASYNFGSLKDKLKTVHFIVNLKYATYYTILNTKYLDIISIKDISYMFEKNTTKVKLILDRIHYTINKNSYDTESISESKDLELTFNSVKSFNEWCFSLENNKIYLEFNKINK